jgi:hypothetical protein
MIEENRDSIWEEFTIIAEQSNERRFRDCRVYHNISNEITWEMFLLIRLLGKTMYATPGQMNRFLEAWKKHIQPRINFSKETLKNLTRKNLIIRIPQKIKFTKGKLRGKEVSVYHLTRKGALLLTKFEDLHKDLEEKEYTNYLRTNEPKGENFYRLKHEILIAEAFLTIFEGGDYVYSLKHEHQLRAEFLKSKNFRVNAKPLEFQMQSLPDFEIEYYDRSSRQIFVRKGEVAVKYSRRQIHTKTNADWWLCYDEREAEKIENTNGQKADILGEELYKEVVKQSGNKTIHQFQNLEIYRRKVEEIGAVTIKFAVLLWGKCEKTVTTNLTKLEAEGTLTKYRLSLIPGESRGRGYSIYVTKKFIESGKDERKAFVKIQAILKSVENDYELADEKKLLLREKKSAKIFTVIADSSSQFDSVTRWENFAKHNQIVEKNKVNKLETIFAVRNSDAAVFYKMNLPLVRVVDISENSER